MKNTRNCEGRKGRYTPAPLTSDEIFAVIICEMAEAAVAKKRDIAELTRQVDDLAQELAVTQSQLEEARKRLKRYEGGGE